MYLLNSYVMHIRTLENRLSERDVAVTNAMLSLLEEEFPAME